MRKLCRRRRVRGDDVVKSRFELRQRCDLLHMRLGSRIFLHGFEIFHAAPLSVVDHLCAIEASVDIRADESGDMAHRIFRSVNEEIDQFPLATGLNGEDVDKGDQLAVLVDGSHSGSIWVSGNFASGPPKKNRKLPIT